MSSTFVQTTLDYLSAFKRFSGFDVDYVHVTHHASMGFDFDGYDVVFHSYCSRLCFEGYVSESYRERLRAFSGVKVLAVQDEYDHTDVLKAAIKDLQFDIVLTCVPQDSLEYVYPRAEFPNVEFITVFTGYVPDDFAATLPPARPLAERPIFIGYRGRDIGGRYGRLGFDKFEVGRRTKELCDLRGIKTDIAMDEASRIYGTAWFDFVGDCRAMLGSESGSNVFDFDGSIEARYKEMMAANGGVPPSYAEFLPIVADRDGEIEMGQISPRVFECAMMRTPMVLFKGRYSDAIVPDEHYIALNKDFLNFDEVLARLEDLPGLAAMTERAFDHLVGSGRFTYRAFYARVVEAIERRLVQKSWTGADTATQVPAEVLDPDGRVLEAPKPWPMGADEFQVRTDVSVVAIYRQEFDTLIEEFARVRAIFENELPRLREIYKESIEALSSQNLADETLLPAWEQDVSDFKRILSLYDTAAASLPSRREQALADFRVALASHSTATSRDALQQMLDIEKDGYFGMMEWIKQLNEAYQAERLQLEHAHRARLDELNARPVQASRPQPMRDVLARSASVGPMVRTISAVKPLLRRLLKSSG